MTLYQHWYRYSVLLAVNLVVISIVIQFGIRGSWAISGFIMLALVVADLFVSRILRKRQTPQGATGVDGVFFRFYGYVLVAGALTWLTSRARHGIAWTDIAPFVILVLLAAAMLSIAKRSSKDQNQMSRRR
jgi:hypothetical protein